MNKEYIPIIFSTIIAIIAGAFLFFGMGFAETSGSHYANMLNKLLLVGIISYSFMFFATKNLNRIHRIICSLGVFILTLIVLIISAVLFHTFSGDDFIYDVEGLLAVYLVPFIIGNATMEIGSAIMRRFKSK